MENKDTEIQEPFLISYPQILEDWWNQELLHSANLRDDKAALKKLSPYVAKLSDYFTTDRELLENNNYYSHKLENLGYGVFFFPQSWMKIRYILSELLHFRKWRLPKRGPLRLLDLGCGQGPASLSMVHFLRSFGYNEAIEITAVDSSPQSLTRLKNLFAANKSLFPNTIIKTQVCKLEQLPSNFLAKSKPFHSIIFSLALNEIHAKSSAEEVSQWFQGIHKKLHKDLGSLILIEPALKETSKKLHQLSTLLKERFQLKNWGPYFDTCQCPLLDNPKFWSHEVRTWRPSRSLQVINQKLWRTIQELKFSYTVLSHQAIPELSASPERLISPVSKMKGKLLMTTVRPTGEIAIYDLQYRDLDPTEKKRVLSFSRGDLIEIQNPKEHATESQYRILSPTDIQLLHSPLG